MAQEFNLGERTAEMVRASTERVLTQSAALLPSLAAGAVVLLVFWGLATLARRGASAAAAHFRNATHRNLIRQVSYYLVWGLGVGVALDVLGFDAQTVVTGLGLGGVALGFALKDVLANLVSGLLILLARTFEIGDQIVVGATEGTVELIEVRATHIRTYDGRLVLVPNGEVFTSRVTNNTASPLRRASVVVYLGYRQDLARALSVILETVVGVTGVAASPPASVRLIDLTPELYHIEARFWTDSRRTDFMQTSSAARIAIVAALAQAGISMPSPDDRRVTIVADPPAATGAP